MKSFEDFLEGAKFKQREIIKHGLDQDNVKMAQIGYWQCWFVDNKNMPKAIFEDFCDFIKNSSDDLESVIIAFVEQNNLDYLNFKTNLHKVFGILAFKPENIKMPPHWPFEERATRDIKLLEKVFATLQSLGIRKGLRVPIVVNYGEKQNVLGRIHAGKKRPMNPIGRVDTNNVNIFAYEGQPDIKFIKTVSHEIGHVIFDNLSVDQQALIKTLSRGVFQPSKYGHWENKAGTIYHKVGAEWFCECLAFLATGNKTSLRQEEEILKQIKSVLTTNTFAHAGADIKSFSDKI